MASLGAQFSLQQSTNELSAEEFIEKIPDVNSLESFGEDCFTSKELAWRKRCNADVDRRTRAYAILKDKINRRLRIQRFYATEKSNRRVPNLEPIIPIPLVSNFCVKRLLRSDF